MAATPFALPNVLLGPASSTRRGQSFTRRCPGAGAGEGEQADRELLQGLVDRQQARDPALVTWTLRSCPDGESADTCFSLSEPRLLHRRVVSAALIRVLGEADQPGVFTPRDWLLTVRPFDRSRGDLLCAWRRGLVENSGAPLALPGLQAYKAACQLQRRRMDTRLSAGDGDLVSQGTAMPVRVCGTDRWLTLCSPERHTKSITRLYIQSS